MQPREQIIIHTKGLVGRFVTSSSNIESALLVISGQIDSKYGERGEAVRFGLKNLLSERNQLMSESRLVHVEFFDLRGVTIDPTHLTTEEEYLRAIWKWKGFDDGPAYE